METMVDIETLATDAKAIVTNIGVVNFDITKENTIGQLIGTSKAWVLNVDVQRKVGRTLMESTLKWWQNQNEAARHKMQEALTNTSDMKIVLEDIAVHCAAATNIWGNGNMFDNVILRSLYEDFDVKYYVSFRNDLDLRTLKYVAKICFPDWKIPMPEIKQKDGSAHMAEIDAASQAWQAQRIFTKLGSNRLANISY